MNEKITLAIPFYRGKEYLAAAIRSVLAQTDPEWELLISDDAGPEGDLSGFVSGLMAGREYCYVRSDTRLGMAGNWNRCLDLTGTDLVTLLHADDELLPNYVSIMRKAAAERPKVAAHFCEARIIGPDGAPTFSFPDYVKRFLRPAREKDVVLFGESALTALVRGNFIMCPTLCYRKNRMRGRRFDPRWKMVLDMDLTTGLLLDGAELHGLSEIAYAYRRHAENATARYTEDLSRFDEEARLYDRLAEDAWSRGWDQSAKAARGKVMIRLHLAYRIVQDLVRGRARSAARKINYLSSLR